MEKFFEVVEFASGLEHKLYETLYIGNDYEDYPYFDSETGRIVPESVCNVRKICDKDHEGEVVAYQCDRHYYLGSLELTLCIKDRKYDGLCEYDLRISNTTYINPSVVYTYHRVIDEGCYDLAKRKEKLLRIIKKDLKATRKIRRFLKRELVGYFELMLECVKY